ncbi:bifunctional enoyl-CoA hydratase/phosphate acetyltransferase [Bradyrhizobium sp. CB2312]|uniref:bifunctional enoyl-CoA hydratase/phosphate acetyltransferase n=1 Tax=Bradyrhizobium sp. CB2312 TaxID=3039155 RepID=UPI0024B0C0AE|nr:bifunctional enoyl-CoA hydratase/phosphate acetyltransferase [Bradyrhizobium sp. CB2312]WFU75564.1 bifunctional enoyl-CoA hydratase/phosphate acetyltransferase [Bradyrhizobium sp. CB2312]
MQVSDFIENRTFDEIAVGESASLTRTLTKDDIILFAVMSGDVNPTHLDERYAETSISHRIVAHGMWGGALISAILGTRLPGPGTVYLRQDLRFREPVGLGDTVTVTVTASEKRQEEHVVLFDCRGVNQNGDEVISGIAQVIAPTKKICQPRVALPEVEVRRHDRYEELVQRCAELEPIRTAVVDPRDHASLEGTVRATELGLIRPVLVGPEQEIRSLAASLNIEITGCEFLDAKPGPAAAATAVALARAGKVDALMKGSLRPDELMHEVVAAGTGLRTERRMSHAFVMDVPNYATPLILTDAGVNIIPTLDQKRDICQNAIDLAKVLGFDQARVAVLSAVENVTRKIPSTLEAAALCKMANRGQITGGIVDGPLTFDDAVSADSARQANIVSPVAGGANILLVPDIESGNMLVKQLTFMSGAEGAGIVLGARVPIILTSQTDKLRTRLASAAAAVLLVHAQRRSTPLPSAAE